MAGGKIDAACSAATQYFVRDNRRGGIPFTNIRFDSGPGQDTDGSFNKPLPHETGITADHDTFFLFTGCFNGIGDGLNNYLHVIKREILAQDSAPAGCSKSD